MEELLKCCNLCPRNCNVDRQSGKIGYCRAGKNVNVALASLHYYEEPCISGTNGSGTIFFAGCNLRCLYCQNYKISQEYNYSKDNIYTPETLAEKFLELQNNNANNINLVTAFMYVPQIVESIKIARKKGLKIPIIYNSSGYENISTLKLLEDYIDVYLPDFKYYDNLISKKLSGIDDYFDVATKAIREMYKQKGTPKYDKDGMITQGVIIRHLILPNHIENSKKVLKWIKDNLPKDVIVSIMTQYFPTYKANEIKEINRKINVSEYNEIENYVLDLDLNGYMQDLTDEDEEKYVPQFENK